MIPHWSYTSFMLLYLQTMQMVELWHWDFTQMIVLIMWLSSSYIIELLKFLLEAISNVVILPRDITDFSSSKTPNCTNICKITSHLNSKVLCFPPYEFPPQTPHVCCCSPSQIFDNSNSKTSGHLWQCLSHFIFGDFRVPLQSRRSTK